MTVIAHLPDVIAEIAGTSRSEARRLITTGGVRLNGRTVTDIDLPADEVNHKRLQIGRRRSYDLGVVVQTDQEAA